MYKVMVVDDESLGRKSIRKMISELALDVEVIAEAKHGEEALEFIAISKPHIVVTDMNMPVMDGQRFLETLHERYGDIRVIVISGYSQFEYLKAAIRYQACEYLLKPVSPKELHGSMIKAIEAIRGYMNLQQRQIETREMRRMKRSVFLQNVTGRRIANKSDIVQQAEELRIEAHQDYWLVVIRYRRFLEAARTSFHGNADLLMFSIENILREILHDDLAPAYKSDDGMSLCLVVPETPSHLDSPNGESGPFEPHRWLRAFHEAVRRMLKLEVLAGISEKFASLAELPEAYQAAYRAILRQDLHGTGLTISSADQTEPSKEQELLTSFDVQAIRQALGSGSVKDCRRLLNDYLERVERTAVMTIARLHQDLAKILEAVLSELKGIAASTLHPPVFDSRTITGVLDPGELRQLMDGWMAAIEAYGAGRREPESAQAIQLIKAYLDAHYFEDVSLIDVATRFHLDPSYLSKLFKSVIAENFIEYVTRKRIEKACELLRSSDRKISDISELVGYENQRYFSQVFKKSTGQTPSEYREAHADETGSTKN
ncbi:response regulator [Paenibacillus macerans]|uniref:response regulator n=1 Tax=Paenibacillus macerans TaxID=44252 RepID=UPI003D3139BA